MINLKRCSIQIDMYHHLSEYCTLCTEKLYLLDYLQDHTQCVRAELKYIHELPSITHSLKNGSNLKAQLYPNSSIPTG